MTHLRGALVLLLVATGCLFAVGSTIERSHRHHESTAVETHASGGETGGEGSKPKPAEQGRREAGARLLGIDTESVGLSVIAVVASLLLAAAAWLRPAAAVLFVIVGFGALFAAGDGRELVHQLADTNNGLAAVAALLLVLHLLIAVLAVALLRRGPARAGLPVPGTS